MATNGAQHQAGLHCGCHWQWALRQWQRRTGRPSHGGNYGPVCACVRACVCTTRACARVRACVGALVGTKRELNARFLRVPDLEVWAHSGPAGPDHASGGRACQWPLSHGGRLASESLARSSSGRLPSSGKLTLRSCGPKPAPEDPG